MRTIGSETVASILLGGCALLGSVGLTSDLPPADPDPAPDPPGYVVVHHCHEDEAQVVTPDGLVCIAVDDLGPDAGTLADTAYRVVVADHDGYTIEPTRE